MEKLSRSQSSREVAVAVPRNMNDLRSYSTSDYTFKEVRMKKSASKRWSFNMDAELQRKKRVAGYKAYGVEGKMKNSFRKSFRWIKDTANNVIHGFW